MIKPMVLGVLILGFAGPLLAGDRTPVVDRRESNQHARIVQGVQSGALTRPETRRLARGEARLRRNEALAKSDGVVTPRERAALNAEAKNMSRRIYRQKHDSQTRN